MVFFNWATMQMAAKIVYYGPGLCGKTTNLSFIYAKTSPGSRGEMVSLETETDRTLFFDLLPIEVGKVGGFRTRLQLYTVPGQVFYNTTRKLVLKGVDGVVFVADSQRPMADANVESLHNLGENLRELGIDVTNLPVVFQYNKRDLKNILSVDELNKALNPELRWEGFEAVAVAGEGVFETLKAITKLTLKSLRRRMAAQEAASAPLPPPPTPRPHVTFSPAALTAAVAEGLAVEAPAAAPLPPVAEAPPAPRATIAEAPTPQPVLQEVSVSEPPAAEARPAALVTAEPVAAAPAPPVPVHEPAPVLEPVAAPVATALAERPLEAPALVPVASHEEPEEAKVEFATTPIAAVPAAIETEVRHVKVASSLDILAELEGLRKASTSAPARERKPARAAPASLDLDSLLQGSINSRQEVRRRVDEDIGDALGNASRCLVSIQLVDAAGKPVTDLSPVEVDLRRGERLRQLALTLTLNLRGK